MTAATTCRTMGHDAGGGIGFVMSKYCPPRYRTRSTEIGFRSAAPAPLVRLVTPGMLVVQASDARRPAIGCTWMGSDDAPDSRRLLAEALFERVEVLGLSLSVSGLWAAWNIIVKGSLGVAASVIESDRRMARASALGGWM